jgi:hypothetical protein
MEYKNNEFRIDTAQPVDAPMDFSTLCALLAAYQAETATARLARDGETATEHADRANPAVAVLLAMPGEDVATGGAPGSFHAAAAARFNRRSR